jgi:MED6 mediator sub complex component
MSDYITFTDPVFLARFGLSRSNALDYFLLPLNPFRTKANTSNETLSMQGTSIGLLMQQGHMYHNYGVGMMPMSPQEAEAEYNKALQKLTGEQYELLPPVDPAMYDQPNNLFTIRHALRTSPTSTKIMGVYYIVEGVIYKSPTIRSLMKSNVARVVDSLSGATSTLSVCARYLPSTGYTYNFEGGSEDHDDDNDDDDGGGNEQQLNDEENPVTLIKLIKRHKRRKILDNRPAGERSEAEEEGLRATHAMDQILVRLNKSPYVAAIATSSVTGPAAVHSSPTKKKLSSTSASLFAASSSAMSGSTTSTTGKKTTGEDDEDVVSVAEPSAGSANSSTTGILSTQ